MDLYLAYYADKVGYVAARSVFALNQAVISCYRIEYFSRPFGQTLSKKKMDEPEITLNEMDFDTVHGLSLTDPSKPLILYWNKKRVQSMLARVATFFLCFFPISVFAMSLMLFFMSILVLAVSFKFASILSFSVLLTICLILAFMGRTILSFLLALRHDYYSCTTVPIMEIRSDGLSIHCPGRNFENIPWSQIKEVTVSSDIFFRQLRIVPEKSANFVQYATEDLTRLGKTWPNSSYEAKQTFKSRHKIVGKFFLAPNPDIIISEQWLPISAKEAAEYINLRLDKKADIVISDNA